MPTIIDPSTGAFHMGGFSAGPQTTSEALVHHFGAALSVKVISPRWAHYRLASQVVEDERYRVTYLCENDVLQRIEFTVWSASSEPPTDADPWNPDKAQQEQHVYDAWLTRQLGGHRSFPWGSVTAVFDLRSTVSFIGIKYEAAHVG